MASETGRQSKPFSGLPGHRNIERRITPSMMPVTMAAGLLYAENG